MHLEKLHVLNFKNYVEAVLEFSPRINVLVGKNGSGKTNLLDAIFYLAFTKSAFSVTDPQCVLQGQNFFMVKGGFRHDTYLYEILSSVQSGSKKVFREGINDYQKLSDHIGKYPVIMIAPDDVDLVKEGSEARRKFFDSIISQLDKKYLEDLIQYNNALKQRNSFLKMCFERGSTDTVALEVYDQMLVRLGVPLFEKRVAFIGEFLPVFQKYYRFIVNEREATDLTYYSSLHDKDFASALQHNRHRDLVTQRTNAGIHRDDYQFTLEGGDLKRLGSQGQQKSFVIALKLAQFEIMTQKKGFKPILLLDDIFDKLDDFRIARLLELMKTDLGQLFITDARPDRTRGLLEQIHVEATVFEIEKGNVTVL